MPMARSDVGTIEDKLRRLRNERSGKTSGLVVLLALAAPLASWAAEDNRPLLGCVKADMPPSIDGQLSDSTWRGSARIFGFVDCEKGGAPEAPSVAYLCYDENYLYLACRYYEPHLDRLKARHKTDGASVHADDCVEVFIDIGATGEIDKGFGVNCIGTHSWKQRGKDWLIATGREEDAWTIEMQIPYRDLATTTPQPGSVWGLNVCRERKPVKEYSAWTGRGTFRDVGDFGRIIFRSEKLPLVTRLAMGNPSFEENEFVLELSNPSLRKHALTVRCDTVSSEDNVLHSTHQRSLDAGASQEVRIGNRIEEEGTYSHLLILSDGDGHNVLWRMRSPEFQVSPLLVRVQRLQSSLAESDAIVKEHGEGAPRNPAPQIKELTRNLAALKKKIVEARPLSEEKWAEYGKSIETLTAAQRMIERESAKLKVYALYRKRVEDLEYGATVTNSMEKVWFDETYGGRITDTAHVKACRGEYEGFQVLILPLWKDLENVEVLPSDLAREDGKGEISRVNITCRPVGYVEVGGSTYFPWREKEIWPDPLLDEPSCNVRQEHVQPVWVTVLVPEATEPGHYRGTLTIRPSNSHKLEIGISLRVWDFALPKERHLLNEFNFSHRGLSKMGIVKWRGDDRLLEVYKRYLGFLLEHRGNSAAVGVGMDSRGRTPWPVQAKDAAYDFSMMDELLQYCIERGQTHFWINMYGQIRWSQRDAGYRKKLREFLRQYTDHLRAKGWLEKACFYNYDEPQCGGRSVEEYDTIRSVVRFAREVCPDLRFMCTTTPSNPETDAKWNLYGYVDLWIHAGSTLSEERRAKGERVIWYGFNSIRAWFDKIDIRGISPRIMYWLSWKTQTDGYGWDWCNKWRRLKPCEGDAIPKWPRVLWRVAGNGVGLIFYPGKDAEAQPISSIRLENMRDGCEDFEYLHLLREKIRAVRGRKGDKALAQLCQEAERLLDLPDEIIRDSTDYTTHPSLLLQYRERVAEKLEALGQ